MTVGTEGVSDAGEAFGDVASEARFDILESLWEIERSGEDAAGFAALRKRTDIDDSGQFNYHLDKLRPRFVRKADEGYTLTHAGTRIVGAAVSGVYTDFDTEIEAREVTECPECGGSVEARYREGVVRVECADCALVVSNGPVPPVAVAESDPEELPELYSRYMLTDVRRLNSGFCVLCGGRIDRSLNRNEDPDPDAAYSNHLGVAYECRTCGMESHGALLMAAVGDPALVSFLHDAGIDLRERPGWELDWFFEATEEVVDEDPLRVEMTVELDERALTLTLDVSLDIVDARRHEPATVED